MIDKNVIIQALQEYAVLMEIKGENPFKVRAYENASRILSGLSEDIELLAKRDQLTSIKGIGKGIAEFVKEFITTGQYQDLEKLKREIPDGIFEMLRIPGMGPKKIKTVMEKLQISTIGRAGIRLSGKSFARFRGIWRKNPGKDFTGNPASKEICRLSSSFPIVSRSGRIADRVDEN